MVTTRDAIFADGVFVEPGRRGWSGDQARHLVAEAKLTQVSADIVMSRAMHLLNAVGSDEAKALAEGICKLASRGESFGKPVELDAFVWLTFDSFGDMVRVDVLGHDEAHPDNLRGTLLPAEVRRAG